MVELAVRRIADLATSGTPQMETVTSGYRFAFVTAAIVLLVGALGRGC
ncbi:hypothetical protein [Streptomyces sp. NPDC051636]